MKKTLKFLLTAFVAVIAAGCKEDEGPVDYPVTGNLNISGRYVTYLHGSQGWVKEDQIGVFVTSDGIEQANLLYEPSEICPATPNEYVEGYYSYEEENYKDGDILLNPVGGEPLQVSSRVSTAYMPTPLMRRGTPPTPPSGSLPLRARNIYR